jgi:hypothetical protein
MFTKHPAGNIMLSFGIMTSGAKISQTLLMFKHMGLSAISPRTYYYHQKRFHFPSLLRHWETYQASLLGELKEIEKPAWSGDGRFDSMGHSAKYGVYTMYSNSISKLVHFELFQVPVQIITSFLNNTMITLVSFVLTRSFTVSPLLTH